MASFQCYKPADQTYNQGQHHASHTPLVSTQTQCTCKTQTYYSDSGLAKAPTGQFNGNNNSHSLSNHSYGYATGSTHPHHGHGTGTVGGLGHGLTHTHGLGIGHTNSCNGMTTSGSHRGRRGEHKRRSMFQKLKDGLSGDNSCSSSDSESDDEHCRTGTRMFHRANC